MKTVSPVVTKKSSWAVPLKTQQKNMRSRIIFFFILGYLFIVELILLLLTSKIDSSKLHINENSTNGVKFSTKKKMHIGKGNNELKNLGTFATHTFPQMKSKKNSRLKVEIIVFTTTFIVQFALISNIKSISESLQRTLINTTFYLIIYIGCIHIHKASNVNSHKKYLAIKYTSLILTLGITRSIIELFFFQSLLFSSNFYDSTFAIKASSIFIYILLAAAFTTIFSLFIQYQEKRKIEKEILELNFGLTESRIQILNNQLSPHFLFNGINDLYSASILDKERTPEMILKLGEILKFVTYQLKKKDIYLVEEIDQIKLQIEYFELRNNTNITLNKSVPEDINEIRVAPFLIVPLVENALKHGNFNDPPSNAFLNIDISKKENYLTISIENSFQELSSKDIFNTNGIGMENYKKRLALLYEGKHELLFSQNENIFKALVSINLNN